MSGHLAVAAGIASAISWGAGDFAGGLATRRAPALRVTLVVQAVGALMLLAAALLLGEPLPPLRVLALSAVAGLSGAVGIVALYAALATGRMGIAAPLSGLLAAVIPVGAGLALEGRPAPSTLAGFAVALAGIALVSAPSADRPPARVFALGALAGVGFGGFLLAMGATGDASVVWVLVAARVAAGAAIAVLAFARGEARGPVPRAAYAAALLDQGGNLFFVLAARLGRLDVAAVLSSLYPAATVLLARVVLGERMTRAQAAGAALVLVAIALIAR